MLSALQVAIEFPSVATATARTSERCPCKSTTDVLAGAPKFACCGTLYNSNELLASATRAMSSLDDTGSGEKAKLRTLAPQRKELKNSTSSDSKTSDWAEVERRSSLTSSAMSSLSSSSTKTFSLPVAFSVFDLTRF
jgi:hypothetical protein